MPVVVRRDNEDVHLQLPPLSKDALEASVAFDPDMVVDRTEPGYPASRLDLQPGDEVVSADGIAVKNTDELAKVMLDPKGAPSPSPGAATEGS